MLNISNMANVYWQAEILQMYFGAFACDSVWRCVIASWDSWEYVAVCGKAIVHSVFNEPVDFGDFA